MKHFDYYSTISTPWPNQIERARERRKEIDDTPMTQAQRVNAHSLVITEVREWFKEAVKPYNQEKARLNAEFWADCREELGYDEFLTDWGVRLVEAEAYERGHSYGYAEIFSALIILVQFVETLKGQFK